MAQMGSFSPGTANPQSDVEISISCRNLKDADLFSKSDPMVVVFVQEFGKESWRELGRTERIDNNLNPDFVRKFQMTYYFEQRQNLKFEVYDIDSNSRKLSDHDFLGRAYTDLGQIVTNTKGWTMLKLGGPGVSQGTIMIRAEEVSACKDVCFIDACAKGLDKMDWFLSKSDPYLEFSRCNEDNSFTVVHRTEVKKNTLNPNWAPFEVKSQTLCNGDIDRTVKVVCLDWNLNGNCDYMGEFETSVRRIAQGVSENTYEVINKDKKKKKKSYKNSGTVQFTRCGVKKVHSFLDYIAGGTQISFVVAIDFTASNGDPRSYQSLHYIDPVRPNHYATALLSVGQVVEQYDTDKLFPVYGFGARLPPHGAVSHDFAVNFNPSNPYVAGLDGILNAYHSCIQSIQLYGPTNFAPIINKVANQAREVRPGEDYVILLIITDGEITDMENTKHAIVQAASLPLSIIIVGVGNASFDAMNELDGDDVRLSSRGRYAERDIVQFVPLREYIGKHQGDPMMVQAILAKEVLAEVPDQFLSFMTKHGIQPNPPRHQPPPAPGSVPFMPSMQQPGGAPPSYPQGNTSSSFASAPPPSQGDVSVPQYSNVAPPPYYG
ncbi:copine-8-like isoform X3 [Convolutriloba macropyga]|uniref:copine-8-like isoform X3 n=1 Tax=Convolutriloba macropyga TaxID=536237 RepID=UPI003F51E0C8